MATHDEDTAALPCPAVGCQEKEIEEEGNVDFTFPTGNEIAEALHSIPKAPKTLYPIPEMSESLDAASESTEPFDFFQQVLETIEIIKDDLSSVSETIEASVPETTDSSNSVPQTIEASHSVPETTESSHSVPETTEASNSIPETTGFSNSVPETTEPSNSVPQTTEPSNSVPQTTEPSNLVPQATEPSNSVPQTTESSNSVLETTELSNSVSETTEASNSVPETTEASNSVPETTEPSNSVPEATKPSNLVPETNEPSNSVPETTEASNFVPETTELSNSVPQTTELSNSVPVATEASNSVPETSEVPETMNSVSQNDEPLNTGLQTPDWSVTASVETSKRAQASIEDIISRPRSLTSSFEPTAGPAVRNSSPQGAAVRPMADQKAALSSPLSERKWSAQVPLDKPPQRSASGDSGTGDCGPAGGGGGGGVGGRGWTFVEAQFPFEYKNDQGRLVKMTCGDRYRLYDRSNDEWWQVIPVTLPERLVGDNPEAVSGDFLVKHSFYIPAKYVQELVEPPSPANSLDRFCGDLRPGSHRRQGSTGTSSSATPDFRDDSGASNDGLEATLGPSPGTSAASASVTASAMPFPLPTPRRTKTESEVVVAKEEKEKEKGPTPGQKPAVSAAFLANLEGKIGSLSRNEQAGQPKGILKTASLPTAAGRTPPSPPSIKPSLSAKPSGSHSEDNSEIIYANIPPVRLTAGSANMSKAWELPGLKKVGRDSTTSQESNEETRDRPTISAPVLDRQIAEKRGHLAKTKVMENSKRVKKNWTQHYVLLRGPCLFFFKDQKAPKSGQPHGRPEFTLPLETVHSVPVDADLTNRKHVIALEDRGAPGSSVVYYLQCEDAVRKNEWTMAITMAKDLSNRKGGPSELLPGDSPGFGASPKRRSFRRKAAHSEPPQPTSLSSLEAGEKQNIVSLLVDFFRKRQPVESLQAKGIIRNEPVFGSTLDELGTAEHGDGVPLFVVRCIEAIESRGGLTTQGIYRVNGNGATIQRLRCLVDQTSDYDLMDSQWELEVLTGSLKLFFRELKEPLIPCAFYDRFVGVIGVKDKSRHSATKKLLGLLPPFHMKTMKYLFQHLDHVVQFSSDNQMHPRNVAIVFGPNLLWPAVRASATNSEGLTATVMWQNQIVEFLLNDARDLFSLAPPLPQRAATDTGNRRG